MFPNNMINFSIGVHVWYTANKLTWMLFYIACYSIISTEYCKNKNY